MKQQFLELPYSNLKESRQPHIPSPPQHATTMPSPNPSTTFQMEGLGPQGEDIRLHMQAIPRDTDPIPLIHVYVDLHLLTLQDAGLLNASQSQGAEAPSIPSTARSFREAEKVAELLKWKFLQE